MVRQENHIVVVVDVVYVNNTFDMALRHVYKQRIAFSFSPSLSPSLYISPAIGQYGSFVMMMRVIFSSLSLARSFVRLPIGG